VALAERDAARHAQALAAQQVLEVAPRAEVDVRGLVPGVMARPAADEPAHRAVALGHL